MEISDVPEALLEKLKQHQVAVAEAEILRERLDKKSVIIAGFRKEAEEMLSKMTLPEIIEFIDSDVRPEIVEFALPPFEEGGLARFFIVLRLKGVRQMGILIKGDNSTLPDTNESDEISFLLADNIYSRDFNLVSLYGGDILQEAILQDAMETLGVKCLIDFCAGTFVSCRMMNTMDEINFNKALRKCLFPWIKIS